MQRYISYVYLYNIIISFYKIYNIDAKLYPELFKNIYPNNQDYRIIDNNQDYRIIDNNINNINNNINNNNNNNIYKINIINIKNIKNYNNDNIIYDILKNSDLIGCGISGCAMYYSKQGNIYKIYNNFESYRNEYYIYNKLQNKENYNSYYVIMYGLDYENYKSNWYDIKKTYNNKLISKFRDFNITRFYYLVFEYGGITLHNKLYDGIINEKYLIHIYDIFIIIQNLYTKPIIYHCDIHLNNIVYYNGKIKLIDFSLASYNNNTNYNHKCDIFTDILSIYKICNNIIVYYNKLNISTDTGNRLYNYIQIYNNEYNKLIQSVNDDLYENILYFLEFMKNVYLEYIINKKHIDI